MGFLKKFFKAKQTKQPDETLADFYKAAAERQQILDSFIDHGLCSSLHGCKSFKAFSKALPAQDIKYIHTRTLRLMHIFEKGMPDNGTTE
jgi:hypothetical protein